LEAACSARLNVMTGYERPAKIIDESRPMLEEFLSDLGIHQPGQSLAEPRLLRDFSSWIDAQNVREDEDDSWYLAVRIASFISEYLIAGHGGVQYIEGKRVMVRFPVDTSRGVWRAFDPYEAAVSLVCKRRSLRKFLEDLCP
jgi:hypothetical protein